MQRDSHLFVECNERIEEFVLTLLLPLYFALSGLKTDISQINTGAAGSMLILVVFVATAGKIFGCGVTSYLSGMSRRESLVVAVLMNTRGLVELIVLNLGLTAGILNPTTFTVMILMALLTTFMTGPLIECIYPVGRRVAYEEKGDETAKVLERLPSEAHDSVIDIGALRGLTKNAKVGLVLDRTDLTPGLLDFVYLLAPTVGRNTLSVRAMQFIEPTNSDQDKFLGLQENDRLIQVKKKNLSLDSLNLLDNDLAARKELYECVELLPVSTFCAAVGADNVDVYRIEGDPDEYPEELRILTSEHGSDVAVMPWTPSDHFGRFFWSRYPSPYLLLAQLL